MSILGAPTAHTIGSMFGDKIPEVTKNFPINTFTCLHSTEYTPLSYCDCVVATTTANIILLRQEQHRCTRKSDWITQTEQNQVNFSTRHNTLAQKNISRKSFQFSIYRKCATNQSADNLARFVVQRFSESHNYFFVSFVGEVFVKLRELV